MGSEIHKKLRFTTEEDLDVGVGEDRISSLSDELIHRILSFLPTPFAVQTSVLSKRWKLVWTTLPFLRFDASNVNRYAKVIKTFFCCRNLDSDILSLIMHTYDVLDPESITNYVKISISHNVEELTVFTCDHCDLSIFSSNSLKKLKLVMNFSHSKMRVSDCWELSEPNLDCWDLPSLTSLHLEQFDYVTSRWQLPESCLICLPALTNLRLDGFDLPNTFSLPALTNLHLVDCKLPQTVWNLPALRSLKLDRVPLSENKSAFFSALVSLQNLTLVSCLIEVCLIYCPQLVYLKLRTRIISSLVPNIVIFAPKLRTVNTVGIFLITHVTRELSKLENVNIELRGCFRDKTIMPSESLKQYYGQLKFMFAGLGSAKILTLDLDTIEALSAVSGLLRCSSSPFHNLKCVRLPRGYKESSLSFTIKSYLLGGSPGATIVTSLPQTDKILQIMPVSVTSQNVGLGEPLANPTRELVNSQGLYNEMCTDTLEMRVQEDHAVENSVVVDGKVRHVGGLTHNTQGTGNDCASSSGGKNDSGIWQGYEVNSEFVGLLDLIMKRYPETFEHFITKNKKFCTIKLNMLCTSVNAFTTTSVTEIDAEMITEYRTLFDDLQRSFNINWLVSRLNYIEQLQFSQNELHAIDSSIDEAKSKLLVLQNLRSEKMTKMHEAFGTMGTNLVTGYIGDDLFSGP